MSVYKRRGSWFCDITIDGRRVQRVLKKARTRAQAIKAESVIQNKLFENKYKVEKRPEVRKFALINSSKIISCLTQNYTSGRTQTTCWSATCFSRLSGG
jgi:hypothetical protein